MSTSPQRSPKKADAVVARLTDPKVITTRTSTLLFLPL